MSYKADVDSKSKFNVDSTVIMANLYYDLLKFKCFFTNTGKFIKIFFYKI